MYRIFYSYRWKNVCKNFTNFNSKTPNNDLIISKPKHKQRCEEYSYKYEQYMSFHERVITLSYDRYRSYSILNSCNLTLGIPEVRLHEFIKGLYTALGGVYLIKFEKWIEFFKMIWWKSSEERGYISNRLYSNWYWPFEQINKRTMDLRIRQVAYRGVSLV